MRARAARRRTWATAVAAVLAVLLSGCVTIPTTGPVEAGAGPSITPDVAVVAVPEPPAPGASPSRIVDGFLQAMVTYQAGYPVAREYLAAPVRDSWRPEAGLTVYDDGYGVTATAESAFLQAPVVGRVGPDGSFRHRNEALRHDFGLVRDTDGQWRISKPPDGLLISDYQFGKFYSRANLYFFDPDYRTLVPDPIFLPKRAQNATVLLQALLRGPSEWLRPAVVTAIPTQARLNVQSASVDADGVVEVSLDESVAALREDQRTRMAGQIAWTLGQIPGVTGVRLSMNGAPYAVGAFDPQRGMIPVSAFGGLSPVAGACSERLYGATDHGVVSVTETSAGADLAPVPGAMGTQPGIEALAVARSGEQFAALTGGNTRLLVAGPGEEAPQTVLTATAMLAPQYAGPGAEELWTITREGGRQTAQAGVPGRMRPVSLPDPQGQVTAFRIAPDGVRIAAVRTVGGAPQLSLGRINRTGTEHTVEAWRPVPLNLPGQPSPSRIKDVAWIDPGTLLVLVDDRKQVKPYRVDQDAASFVEIAQPENWDAQAVATCPRGVGTRAVILGRHGSWRYEDDYRWPFLTPNLVAAAYAG